MSRSPWVLGQPELGKIRKECEDIVQMTECLFNTHGVLGSSF